MSEVINYAKLYDDHDELPITFTFLVKFNNMEYQRFLLEILFIIIYNNARKTKLDVRHLLEVKVRGRLILLPVASVRDI